MAKTRVVVLGAGLGGLTAAYHLSSSPELRDRFEVTVYQCGWRVGGKGASGRNGHSHQRIEEHGLHVWFGFYDNAFRLMQDCYSALGRPPGSPLDSWRAAFEPCSSFVLYEDEGDGWKPWCIEVPENRDRPGEPRPFEYWGVAAGVIAWLRDRWRELLDDVPDLRERDGSVSDEVVDEALALAARLVTTAMALAGDTIADRLADAEHLVRLRAAGLDTGFIDFDREFTDLLVELKDLSWLAGAPLMHHEEVRRFLILFDLAATLMHGISHDRLEDGTYDADALDLRAWMATHGAKARTCESAPVRALYDLVFAYQGGDVGRPDLAAGKAVAALVRIVFDYKGAVTWKMQAGMGDAVFTPLYQVLQSRGVEFRFFHWATDVRTGPDRKLVDRIDLIRQVDLAGGAPHYDPLVLVKDLPCWPSEPKWELLEDGAALSTLPDPPAFEHVANPLDRPDGRVILRRGDDFDVVVLAIPVGALPWLCSELVAANPRFATMVDGASTVATQAFQVWLNRPLPDLGWEFPPNSIAGAYADPVDTYCNMSHLLERECWEADEARSIGYFCGVYPDPTGPESQSQANAEAKDTALTYMDGRLGPLWPAAVGADHTGPIQWPLLVDDGNGAGRDRFDRQYWRANTTAWERYVLTRAGSTRTRLHSDESGFDNLVLAGDWTRNGIDGGCVEAAVISGMQAARALSGDPLPIANEGSWLQGATTTPIEEAGMETQPRTIGTRVGAAVDAGLELAGTVARLPLQVVGDVVRRLAGGPARPAAVPVAPPAPVQYVNFGGLTTFPGPYHCTGTKLWVWFPKVDGQALRRLCEKTFSAPTGGAVKYRPIWPRVMLTFGEIDEVIPEPEPFRTYGSLTERQVALWVPTIAIRDGGPLPFDEATGAAMFVPYIWLDNGMSFATGREGVGWPKTWGWPLFPSDGQDSFTLDVFALEKFGENERPDRYPLLEVIPEASDGSGADGEIGLDRLDDVVEVLSDLAGDEPLVTWTLARTVFQDLIRRQLRQVFLKQVRGVADGRQAGLQQIVEASARVTRLARVVRQPAAELIVHPVASQNVIDELGLQSQPLDLGLMLEMDFVQENGTVVWDAYGRGV